jgi:hypothetical protein
MRTTAAAGAGTHTVTCTNNQPIDLPLYRDCHRPTSAAARGLPPCWSLLPSVLLIWQCVAGPVGMCDANLHEIMLM